MSHSRFEKPLTRTRRPAFSSSSTSAAAAANIAARASRRCRSIARASSPWRKRARSREESTTSVRNASSAPVRRSKTAPRPCRLAACAPAAFAALLGRPSRGARLLLGLDSRAAEDLRLVVEGIVKSRPRCLSHDSHTDITVQSGNASEVISWECGQNTLAARSSRLTAPYSANYSSLLSQARSLT